MSTTVYVDTNVIMDFLLDRRKSAATFFIRARSCEFSLVLSTLTIKELAKYHASSEVELFLKVLREKAVVHDITEEDKRRAQEAVQTHDTHYADALHYVVARRVGATILLTQNTKDFLCFDDILIRGSDDI
ncbi:MAG: PIN domain-containing protein [Candidatus Woesearchaeota archaeon]|nr:PIN domain-containing protein [Candidatus Woesearchaeota archaeon]